MAGVVIIVFIVIGRLFTAELGADCVCYTFYPNKNIGWKSRSYWWLGLTCSFYCPRLQSAAAQLCYRM